MQSALVRRRDGEPEDLFVYDVYVHRFIKQQSLDVPVARPFYEVARDTSLARNALLPQLGMCLLLSVYLTDRFWRGKYMEVSQCTTA